MSKREYDFLCQHIRPEFPALESGDRTTVCDEKGNEYLDFASQTLNLNLGQLHPDVVSNIKTQLERIQYTSSKYFDPTALEFAEELVKAAPKPLTRVNHKMTGGSLANECAIKMARRNHEGKMIASPRGSFFGETLATMECASDYQDSDLLPNQTNSIHVSPPRAGVSAGSIEDVIESWKETLNEREDICGVITTPLEINAGLTPEPSSQGRYLAALRDLCDDNDVALIFDEAQTGFGWLKTPFAAQHFDIVPDILTVSKAVAAGLPLGATICKEEYDSLQYGEHEFTNGANPIACAAGLACISKTTNKKFQEKLQNKINHFHQHMRKIEADIEKVNEVRTIGLIAGIEIDQSQAINLRSILKKCMERGLLFRISGDFKGGTILAKPPLVISKSEIDDAMQILKTVLKTS